MRQKTSLVWMNGTWYLRIPPALKAYLNLKVGDDTVEIEDKEKGKGKYAAFWGVDSNVKTKE